MQLATALAQTPLPRNLLVWLTVQVPFNQMDMLICPPKSQIAGLTGHQDQCILCGVPVCCGASRNGPCKLRGLPMSLLHLEISPFCGQQRSIWKCGFDSPSERSLGAAILSCSYCPILNPLCIVIFLSERGKNKVREKETFVV